MFINSINKFSFSKYPTIHRILKDLKDIYNFTKVLGTIFKNAVEERLWKKIKMMIEEQ